MASMATFSVGFLGCKVSHADAQEVRARLLGDGHAEAAGEADVAVISTCCVTHEAVRKSRKAAHPVKYTRRACCAARRAALRLLRTASCVTQQVEMTATSASPAASA